MAVDPSGLTTLGAVVGVAHALQPTIDRMLGQSADLIGERLKNRVGDFFNRNAHCVLIGAAAMVEESGLAPHEVPTRILVPLLEGSAREDDPTLQELWSALIANASVAPDTTTIPPYFATALAQLSPFDAAVFMVLQGTVPLRSVTKGIFMGVRPGATDIRQIGHHLSKSNRAQFPKPPDLHLVASAVDLLDSLGLVLKSLPESDDSNFSFSKGLEVRITDLGVRFRRACTRPATAECEVDTTTDAPLVNGQPPTSVSD